MRRQKIVVRLGHRELQAAKQLADMEHLPVSTLARLLLLKEVDRRGLWLGQAEQQAAGGRGDTGGND